jgi:hypothetical protein
MDKQLVKVTGVHPVGCSILPVCISNRGSITLMKKLKILVAILLCLAISQPEEAPAVTMVEAVLAITVIAIAGTAVYVVLKCAKKLNQPKPPNVESSTNNVTWTPRGAMQLVDGNWQWRGRWKPA